MSVRVSSILEDSAGGQPIDVECHISNGLPNIIVVGFANKAIDEAKERIRSAFASSQLELPRKRITINLAPADLPKDGTSFDMAMSAAILLASGQCRSGKLEKALLIGELGLDGAIRPVRGIIGKLLAGRKLGYTSFFIPSGNMKQARLVPDITLVGINTLKELYLDLTDTAELGRIASDGMMPVDSSTTVYGDFTDVAGQPRAKRALEIAAAGGHNVMLSGAPGTGKSMLAKTLPSILPPLTREEILEATHLHSLSSRQYDQLVTVRPFRAPHHTASDVSILGGGTNPRPGEISLAHHGVLFFDELPEYGRATLEALRQPLEDRVITVARARDSVTFPANFMLIATANPCPCGYYGTSKPCSCLPQEVVKYQRRLSGPILDRIDLFVEVDEVQHASLLANSGAESSGQIRRRVIAARKRQQSRFGNAPSTNASLTNNDIKRFAYLDEAARELLDTAAGRLNISARSYMRVIKVARTIADLEGSAAVATAHISEALQYRRQTTLQPTFA